MSCNRTVHGWSAGPGGSEWYRLALPLSVLANQYGYDVGMGPLLTHNIGNGARFSQMSPPDIVIVQRPMTAVALSSMRYWSRKSLTMIAVDLDDDMWSIPEDNPAHRLATPELLARLESCLALADVVTVSTSALAERVSKHTTSPIRVVGNYVPEALATRPLPALRGHKVTVGWAGSPTHLGDWQANAAGIRAALDYSNKIDFHIVGADYGGEVADTRRAIRHTPFQPDIIDYYSALDFNIALAPLAYNEFNRSKSDIRILESAAIGAVPVMTSWGPYAKVSGRHVSDFEYGADWRQHIAELISDPQQLHEERAVWRAWAQARTIEANAYRWRDIYESVM